MPAGSGITQSGTGGGSSGVASVNALTGAVILAAGTDISLVPSGNTITINSTGIVPSPILYADLLTLYNGGTMTPGFYNITDTGAADRGIVIQAISSKSLAENGTGLFLNCDFQTVGTYTYTPTVTTPAYHSTLGVWNLSLTPVPGDIVFWNNAHYVNVSGSVGSAPDIDSVNWTEMIKSVYGITAGYILEADYIEYNIAIDSVSKRVDRRGNDIVYRLNSFQWGNDLTLGCRNIFPCIINNINQRGENIDLSARGQCNLLCDNSNIGIVSSVDFDGMGANPTFTINFNAGTLNGCTIKFDQDIIFSDQPYNSYVLIKDAISAFQQLISITGLTTLDFTSNFNYIGVAGLTSANATETINLFANFPINQPVQLRPASGLIITFTHATGANQPICAGGISAVLNGSNGDWIEFTRKETYTGSGVYRIYQTAGETY